MIFQELNRTKCKTYLVACEKTRRAALVDPIREKLERYLAFLAYHGLRLEMVFDTHTHADHRSAGAEIRDLTGATLIMHRCAPSPCPDMHVGDGDEIPLGDLTVKVLHTPGHTPDSVSLVVEDRVFTGDVLLIRGTGRTDFPGGDSGDQFDSITQKLFSLPEETLVFPAHDYRGNSHSTIGEEKRGNPRIFGRTRDEYVALMQNLGLPLPDKIQEVLQPNQSSVDDDQLRFPTLAELNSIRQLAPQEVEALLLGPSPPVLIDVREPEEFRGELGHIAGSFLVPLREITARAAELEKHRERHLVVICRAGVRSTTCAAILTALGFESVSNLKGGMLAWQDLKLPVER
jgi:glyoxylase-like metal-dependent hydrolase (beta-lactamase superfamily II)/rhodanese-related sulfurtransferase